MAADRLSLDDAAHLAGRTGFGPEPQTVAALVGLPRAQAVRQLLDGIDTAPVIAPPKTEIPSVRPKDMDEKTREAFVKGLRGDAVALKGWWWAQILSSRSPLAERLVLVWHNHFTSGIRKVKLPAAMLLQHQLFRREAAGSFAALLRGIVRDPAMLLYLDGAQNRKGAPNENLARELMELFTLGEGAYGEADVREAARALTGVVLDPREARNGGNPVRFAPMLHDGGQKTILGKTGAFDADGLVDLLLSRPETARTVATKLARAFVAAEPERATVEAVAARLRETNWQIRPAMETLLLSEAFWAPANRGVLIKSPVELLAGAIRVLGVAPPDVRLVAFAATQLGQDLFEPPNVKGWPGGTTWITADTLLKRRETMTRFLRGMERADKAGMDMAAAMARAPGAQRIRKLGLGPAPEVKLPGGSAGDLAERVASFPEPFREAAALAGLLLRVPPVEAEISGRKPVEALVALLLDPAFNLA